jgi:tetratricopeptide (TPR) repeat protein
VRHATRAVLLAAAAFAFAAPALPQDAAPDEADLARRFESAAESERAGIAVQLAQKMESESRWSEAATWWRRARKLRGSVSDLEGEARALLAFAEEVAASGEGASYVAAAVEDAKTALRRAREAGSKSVAVPVGLARCAELSGDADAQIAELKTAYDAFPADMAAHAAYVRACAAMLAASGRADEALAVVRPLSDERPEDAGLALQLAAVAKQAGDEQLELTGATRAVTAAIEDARGWIALWKVFSPKQRWGELADAVLAIAKANPKSSTASHYAGMACATARRFDEALVLLEKAWTAVPNDSPAKLEAARILFTEKHDRDGAVRLYSEVLAKEPSSVQASNGLFFVAKRYTDEGKPALSVPLFETVARARPGDPAAQGNLANAYRFAGRYDDSERAYLAAIAVLPTDAQLRNDYALLLDVMGRDADAVRVLHEAHEVDPTNNDSMENLGFLARARGERDEALRWFRAASAAAVTRGDLTVRHRITVDDQRWPLPPLH